MIERPTNDETYRQVRSRVLDDLRDRFRRARSDTPVVGIEDLALLRNVVRPALDQTKVGMSAREFLADGPLLPILLKHAGEGTDYLSSQLGEAGALFKGAPGFLTPEMAGKLQDFGKQQGIAVPESVAARATETSDPNQSWLQKGLGGVMSFFNTLAAPGKALYNVGQGLAGGALGGISPDALQWSKENLKPVDRAAEWVAGDLPVALGTGGASMIASGAKAAVPALAGIVGRDIAVGALAPAAITGAVTLGKGISEGQLPVGEAIQAAQNVGVSLPWAEEATQSAPAAASAVQDTVAAAPQSFDMSQLFNRNYWGGGGMMPSMAQGFSGEIGNLLKGFDPSMLGGLG